MTVTVVWLTIVHVGNQCLNDGNQYLHNVKQLFEFKTDVYTTVYHYLHPKRTLIQWKPRYMLTL